MHWFDHFLTKLSKYLWIKTGDRHYHFVEPWVIDRPFCRMETVYQNHFVETGVGSLQNGGPQPHPGNGNVDPNVSIYTSTMDPMGDIKTLEICAPTPEVQNCLRPAAQVCRASLERNLPTVAAELPAPWGELKTWLDAWP